MTNAAQVVGMTEFPQDLRHYCRNPRCRSKLPSPVSNPREAFCTRGCYESFHLKRCRVCEQPLEAKYRKIKNGGDRTKFVRVQNSARRAAQQNANAAGARGTARAGFRLRNRHMATRVAKNPTYAKKRLCRRHFFARYRPQNGVRSLVRR